MAATVCWLGVQSAHWNEENTSTTKHGPLSMESPAPCSSTLPASAARPGHARAEVLHKNRSVPLLAAWSLHPFVREKVSTRAGHGHMPAGTSTHAARDGSQVAA